MTTFWMVLIVFFLFVIVFRNELKKNGHLNGSWPFYAKKPLTEVERILYHRLVKALPDHIVLAQVQLSRVLGVKRGYNFNEWNNRINRMSLDFVVCHKDSTIVSVIELDDQTHERESRKEADVKKNKALSSAGLSLVRWQVKQIPSEREIREHFFGQEQHLMGSSLEEVTATGEGELTF